MAWLSLSDMKKPVRRRAPTTGKARQGNSDVLKQDAAGKVVQDLPAFADQLDATPALTDDDFDALDDAREWILLAREGYPEAGLRLLRHLVVCASADKKADPDVVRFYEEAFQKLNRRGFSEWEPYDIFCLLGFERKSGRPRRDALDKLRVAEKVVRLQLESLSFREARNQIAQRSGRSTSSVERDYYNAGGPWLYEQAKRLNGLSPGLLGEALLRITSP